jgi:hypothetical protein
MPSDRSRQAIERIDCAVNVIVAARFWCHRAHDQALGATRHR